MIDITQTVPTPALSPDESQFAHAVQTRAFGQREAIIRAEISNLNSGQGQKMAFDRTYSFNGLRITQQGCVYDSKAEFERDIASDTLSYLDYVAGGSFNVKLARRDGNQFAFFVTPNPGFERALAGFHADAVRRHPELDYRAR